jgi:hypothetical protein
MKYWIVNFRCSNFSLSSNFCQKNNRIGIVHFKTLQVLNLYIGIAENNIFFYYLKIAQLKTLSTVSALLRETE